MIFCTVTDTRAHVDIGERLRQLRTAAGLSVRTLAARTAFSPSFISQVENGQASPSIASLERIAAAVGATLVEFFDPRRATDPVVVRAAGRQRLRSTWSRAEVEALGSADGAPKLEPVMITIAPGGRSSSRPEAHGGEEFALVFEGEATLTLGDEVHVLGRGDAVTFSSEVPHAWENTGLEPARIVLVSPRFTH
jgi:transcriptional regulator with XRE-family HTH domain